MIEIITSRLFYIIYGAIIVASAIYSFFNKNKIVNKLLLGGILISFVFFACIRSEHVGLDTVAYSKVYSDCSNFETAKNIISRNKPEYLFYLWVTFFSCVLNANEIVFRISYYLLIAICLFFAFHKLKHNLFLFCIFLFLGFFNMSFSGIRQTMSISIMTLALSFYIFSNLPAKKKILIYYLLNLISIGFHSSSILMLFIPLLFLMPIKKESFIYLFPLLIFIPQIIKKGVYFVSFYTYVGYGFGSYRISITFILTLLLVLIYYLFVSSPFISKFLKEKLSFISFSCENIDLKLVLLVFASLAFMACNYFSLVLPRYSMYFYLGVSIFISYFFKCFKKPKLELISYISILLIFYFYFIYSVPSLGLVPYSTVL